MVSVTLFMLGLSYGLSIGLGLGVVGIFIELLADYLARLGFLTHRFWKGDWIDGAEQMIRQR